MIRLSDLKARGTKLSEVEPNFQGMPLKLWNDLVMAEQSSDYLATQDPAKAPLAKKAVATPLDNYGMKGF